MDKILVVIDMQNDFVTGSLRNEEAIRIIPSVKRKIEEELKKDVRVYFTQDTHFPSYLSSEEGKNLPVEHCIGGSWGWEIIPELKEYAKDLRCGVYSKYTFGSTDLGKRLSAKYIKEIEIIGICTDICVISNALLLKAFCPEAHIVVDASCCAGVTPESHKTALEAMKACQIEIREEYL